jgi:hypothetical protein
MASQIVQALERQMQKGPAGCPGEAFEKLSESVNISAGVRTDRDNAGCALRAGPAYPNDQ